MQYTGKKEININCNKLFKALDLNDEMIKKIDPNLKKSTLLESEVGVGAHYEQEYHFRKKEFTYTIELIHYRNEEELKLFGASGDVMGAIDIDFIYQIAKIDEDTSIFEYQVNVKSKKLWAKPFTMIPSSIVTKAVNSRLARIKKLI